jgi:hypothetical protein
MVIIMFLILRLRRLRTPWQQVKKYVAGLQDTKTSKWRKRNTLQEPLQILAASLETKNGRILDHLDLAERFTMTLPNM